jgi:hypothetical protein
MNSSPLIVSPDRLCSPEEVAAYFGLKSANTLAVWRCTKRYPALRFIKVGRLVRYRLSVVEAFLAARTGGVR